MPKASGDPSSRTFARKIKPYNNKEQLGKGPDAVFQLLIRRMSSGTWVFSDESLGIVDEPFVYGINEIIDQLLKDNGLAVTAEMEVTVRFFSTFAEAWKKVRNNDGWNNLLPFDMNGQDLYPTDFTPVTYATREGAVMQGGFCPVFKVFFPDPVEGIYCQIIG